jgi:hypothetical protein
MRGLKIPNPDSPIPNSLCVSVVDVFCTLFPKWKNGSEKLWRAKVIVEV